MTTLKHTRQQICYKFVPSYMFHLLHLPPFSSPPTNFFCRQGCFHGGHSRWEVGTWEVLQFTRCRLESIQWRHRVNCNTSQVPTSHRECPPCLKPRGQPHRASARAGSKDFRGTVVRVISRTLDSDPASPKALRFLCDTEHAFQRRYTKTSVDRTPR